MNAQTVNEPMVASSNDLNTPRSRRASTEAELRAKKAYAARWHKSLGRREQVCDVRGYGPRRGVRAPDPETGREPQYNEPDYGLWTEEDEEIMDAGLLTAWECFARRPCTALMGRR